jgi:hypothetical protein
MLGSSQQERLLAYTCVDKLTIETYFEGVVSSNGGAYVTYVSSASSKPVPVRRYPGVDGQLALAGHLAFIEEIRDYNGRPKN